jgi:Response regulator containing a CheY-like receiver domain and an HTH DNA-binding domain
LIRVLIVDDHAIVRRGIRDIIADETDMTVVAEAADGAEALARAHSCAWDVLLLDLAMPGMHGTDVLARLRRECPGKPVLIVTMHPEEEYGPRLLRAGAAGYLPKESAPDLLVTAIRQVAAGERYLSPRLAALVEKNKSAAVDRPMHAVLSERETQVLRHIANGRALSDISELMALSPKTVSTYRYRLLVKMHMKSNAELTRYAVENKLV